MFCMETTLKRKLICKGNHRNHIKVKEFLLLYFIIFPYWTTTENMTRKNHKIDERYCYHSHSLGSATSAKEERACSASCKIYVFLL